jgi:hypothetical protein
VVKFDGVGKSTVTLWKMMVNACAAIFIVNEQGINDVHHRLMSTIDTID